MSCGICNRWQHIPCHDSADARAGRARRNWDEVDFTCRKCQEKRSGDSKKKLLHIHPQSNQSRHPSLPQQPSSHAHNAQAARSTQPHANGRSHVHEEAAFVPAYSKRDIPRQSNSSVTFAHYQPLQQGFRAEPLPRLMLSPRSSPNGGHGAQVHGHGAAFPPYANGHASLGMNGYGTTHPSAHVPGSAPPTGTTPYASQHQIQTPQRADHRPAGSTWIPYATPGVPPQTVTQFRDGYPANLSSYTNAAYLSQQHPQAVPQQQHYQSQNAYPHQYQYQQQQTAVQRMADNRLNPPIHYNMDVTTNYHVSHPLHTQPPVHTQQLQHAMTSDRTLPPPHPQVHSQSEHRSQL